MVHDDELKFTQIAVTADGLYGLTDTATSGGSIPAPACGSHCPWSPRRASPRHGGLRPADPRIARHFDRRSRTRSKESVLR
jgi:hypothetical protein